MRLIAREYRPTADDVADETSSPITQPDIINSRKNAVTETLAARSQQNLCEDVPRFLRASRLGYETRPFDFTNRVSERYFSKGTPLA